MYIKHTQCRRDDLWPKYNSSNLETFQNSKRAIYGLLFIHEQKALNSKSTFYFPTSTLVLFFLFYFLCNRTVLKANSDTFNLPEYRLICLTYINLHHSRPVGPTLALEVIPWLYSLDVSALLNSYSWLGWLYYHQKLTGEMFQFYERCQPFCQREQHVIDRGASVCTLAPRCCAIFLHLLARFQQGFSKVLSSSWCCLVELEPVQIVDTELLVWLVIVIDPSREITVGTS